MENNQEETVNQIYGYAAELLVDQKKKPDEVKNSLVQQGVDLESATIVVENLQSQIKQNGKKDMLYGALWCVGGTIATVSNVGYIFWGAIIFGAVQFIRGASKFSD